MFRHRRRDLSHRLAGTCGWVQSLCEQFDDGREEVEGDEGNSGKIGGRGFPWVSRRTCDGVYEGSLVMIFVNLGC